MIKLKTADEIELLRQSSLLVSATLTEIARMIQPGIKTIDLDKAAESFIRDHGAVPGFKGYNGFPNTLCISVNEQVVHGIPGDRELKDGDIVSVDCGVIKDGFYGDSAYTFPVGEVNKEILSLLAETKASLYEGIKKAVHGARVGDIGHAIQSYVEPKGYSVVRDLVGHGLGRNLHEKPEVPNYGRRGMGTKLKEGMVICIEPMINLGARGVFQSPDGWTILTSDRKVSAHYEHAVAIKRDQADILSSFEEIESVLKAKN